MNVVLLIDEISRGNVASIFGELITLIEEDKRDGGSFRLESTLPYSQQRFSVPGNLFIIGTMNTADRSVEALDAALRRRFVFHEVPPEPDLLKDIGGLDVNVIDLLETLNRRIERLLDKDHCLGHSYFLKLKDSEEPLRDLNEIFALKILPLLQEYFYNDPVKIGMVLGKEFVRKKGNGNFAPGFEHAIEDSEARPLYEVLDPLKFKDSTPYLTMTGVEDDQ